MKDRLTQLQEIKRNKTTIYNSTPSNSWKKQLRRFEIELIDGKIKIEKLKRQYQ